jgi:DNA-binding beta-propeller fold protein YncE
VKPNVLIRSLVALVAWATLAIPPAHAADLFVSSVDSNSVVRFDGKTGVFRSVFVPPGSGGLAGTHGLVFGPDGNLYVNNRLRHSVLRYNGKTGAFIDTFVPPHSGGLDTNIGLVFGPDGNLYVSCHYDSRVLRYNGTTGAFIDIFVPGRSGGLNGAYGLFFGPDRNLYVCSTESHSVLRYDGRTGYFLGAFVPQGSGGLNRPTGGVFGPDGNLYVSSHEGSSVLRYDGVTGAFLGTFVATGSGGLDRPSGLMFGPDGNLYVCGEGNNQVLRYDGRTGAFLGLFGSGELAHPTWLTFSPPEAPSGLTVTAASASQVSLAWTDNSDEEAGFEIERKTGNGPFTSLAFVGPNLTTFIDGSVSVGATYTYRVRAISAFGRSVASNEVEIGISTGGKLRIDRLLLLPSTRVGGTSALTLFLDNVGTGVLAGNVGTLAPPFAVLSGAGRFVLGPGQSQAVVISFTPTAAGGFAGNLAIQSTDIEQPTVNVLVVGEGDLAPR